MEMNKELLAKAKAAQNVEELMSFAKANNVELSEESARAYFEQMHAHKGEIADEELDNVSGGGCHNGDGRLITTVLNGCIGWDCKYTEQCNPSSLQHCVSCGRDRVCRECSYCSYEKGLWLCNNDRNRKH